MVGILGIWVYHYRDDLKGRSEKNNVRGEEELGCSNAMEKGGRHV